MRSGKKLFSEKIVLAAGIWSKELASGIGLKVPLESERGYHLFLSGANKRPPFPLLVTDGKFIITPMTGGLRCAGIVEFGGLKAIPSRAPLELLKRKVKQVYRGLEYDDELTWMGHRPSTPDSLPVIGSHRRNKNVYFAFGSQHIGLTIGPKIGKVVSDLILEKRNNFDYSPFSPERFL